MADIDFPSLLKEARQFDEMLEYARKKLLDASKLGMGMNAFHVMSGIKNELNHLLINVDSLSKTREEENKSLSAQTLDIFEFLESVSNELDHLESVAAEEGCYEPFQQNSAEYSCNMVSPLVSNENGVSMPPRRLLDFDSLNIE